MLVGELVDINGLSTVARSSGEAVDDHLGREGHLGPLISSLDVDSVSKGGGGCLSPARSAVDGNVLVDTPAEVVDSVDITPVPFFWESVGFNILLRLFSTQDGDLLVLHSVTG